MSEPDPVLCSDRQWWDAYGMCGGCGSAYCHDGPCSEIAGFEPFYGQPRSVCGRCYYRQESGDVPALHVVPHLDLAPHVTDRDCWCRPAWVRERGKVIATHRSLDGRELRERDGRPFDWSDAMYCATRMAAQGAMRFRVWRNLFGWSFAPTDGHTWAEYSPWGRS